MNSDYRDESFSVLAVIVLYKMRPRESTSFQSLQKAIAESGGTRARIRVLLYDNSPVAASPEDLPHAVTYVWASRNRGVSGAYTHALTLAAEERYSWLLTLDQDTMLTEDFLSRMSEAALRFIADEEVGAVVPQLTQRGKTLSPVCIGPWGVDYIGHGFVGFAQRETHAYNSGSLFRVHALEQIGGFSQYFWLDYLDAYVYKQLYRYGKRIYVAGDIQVEHDLSLLSPGTGLTTDRFENFLLAECAFCDLYGSWTTGAALTLRLLARLCRQMRRGERRALRELTRDALKRRVLQRKAQRIQEWRSRMEERMPLSDDGRGEADTSDIRPTISVCMAAYNGERYIAAQLDSILSQLSEQDEVVIVDDGSSDGTRERVRALQDGRIRLIEHVRNLGVSQSFEDAIRNATKSIIFLSDQDDLWAPDKVSTILEEFRKKPEVTLVASDAALIDQDGQLISDSYFADRGSFNPGFLANLVRNRYGGCTMAFRTSILSEILPLPHRWNVLHDIWIGVRNSLAGHRTAYINRPLVFNRRHASTATGKRRLSVVRRLRIRAELVFALGEHFLHLYRSPHCSSAENQK